MAKFTLDALRQSIADLFDKSEDQETIKRYAVVESELNKAQDALNKMDEKELSLLKDLKEAYLHTSVKPSATAPAADPVGSTFNADAFISEYLQSHQNTGGQK